MKHKKPPLLSTGVMIYAAHFPSSSGAYMAPDPGGGAEDYTYPGDKIIITPELRPDYNELLAVSNILGILAPFPPETQQRLIAALKATIDNLHSQNEEP